MQRRIKSYYRLNHKREANEERIIGGVVSAVVLGFALAWVAYGEGQYLEANQEAFISSQAVEEVQTTRMTIEDLIAPPAQAEEPTVKVETVREVSAYTSEPGQTDSTPCIAADGSDICLRHAAGEGICATNAFPLGTKLFVGNLGTCTVADRMNARYKNRVDWYMGLDTPEAINFGIQNLNVEIYGE